MAPTSVQAVDTWNANERADLFDNRDSSDFQQMQQTAFPGVPYHVGLPGPTQTDADGRFDFRGVGADHLLVLEVSGQRIAKETFKRCGAGYGTSSGVSGSVGITAIGSWNVALRQ